MSFGGLLAFVHYLLVEMRPVLLLFSMSFDIGMKSAKSSYTFLSPDQMCSDLRWHNCSIQMAANEHESLLFEATTSLNINFGKEGGCSEVYYLNDNYGTFVLAFVALALCFLVSVYLFIFVRAARKAGGLNFRSGSYFVFTVTLRRNPFFMRVIYGFMAFVFIVLLASIGLIAYSAVAYDEDSGVMILNFLSDTGSRWLLLMYSVYCLLYCADGAEFFAWNSDVLALVTFKRAWYSAFISSNDVLYHDIVFATQDAHRGNRENLRKLCHSDEALALLTQSLQLPNLGAQQALAGVQASEVAPDAAMQTEA